MSKELIERLRNTTYHNLDPYEAADRIEQLEAEVERLSSMCCCDPEFNLSMYAGGASAEGLYGTLTMQMQGVFVKYVREEQLAASQAREQQLREALVACVCAMQDYQAGIGITELFDKGERLGRLVLLSEKQDTTAFEAMIQKAGEVMREWCVYAMWDYLDDPMLSGHGYANGAGEEIRALPNVTLEDLK